MKYQVNRVRVSTSKFWEANSPVVAPDASGAGDRRLNQLGAEDHWA